MRRHLWIGVLLVALLSRGGELAAQSSCCAPSEDCFLKRLGPVGGWNPYGGGLLHWWDPCCFPHCGGPNDYCRKPLPNVCWPPYPPYYIWGMPERGCSQRLESKPTEAAKGGWR
jgi:hypothetical protein